MAIESYGSLAVALFWAFTNATVDLEGAKASYGLIIAGAQIGAIIGEYGVFEEGMVMLSSPVLFSVSTGRDNCFSMSIFFSEYFSWRVFIGLLIFDFVDGFLRRFDPPFVFLYILRLL